MSIRAIVSTITGLILLASFVPAFVSAQTVNCQSNNHWWNLNAPTTCTSGNLSVYVQVTNGSFNNITRNPSDFVVAVTGANANPSSFPGSLSGTSVTVNGSYVVQALQLTGYAASYSQGCSGNIVNGESASCIITESSNSGYYNNYPNTYYPNQYYPSSYYGYNGYTAPLTCSPASQTVTVGTNVTFTAQGGQFSQFNWMNSAVPNGTQYNIGTTYTTTLLSPGVNTITVMNGAQSATCSINVVGYPVVGYGAPGVISPIGATTYPGGVSLTPTYIPSLPNTGFGPQDGAAFALAVVLLIASGVITYPYVRKALAIVTR